MDISEFVLELLREDTDSTLYRCHAGDLAMLALVPAERSPRMTRSIIERELDLSELLKPEWAVTPIKLGNYKNRTCLLLRDTGGILLDRVLDVPMDLTEFLALAIGLTAALRQFHATGLIHNDLKPTNIMVDETGRSRLTGFGRATPVAAEDLSSTTLKINSGTLAYISPEQTGRVNKRIDTRSDLYSLGVILYEMFTGRLPFSASDTAGWIHSHTSREPILPSLYLPDAPQTVSSIILKLLAKQPEDRYQSAATTEADLRHCLQSWKANARIQAFPLGRGDRSTQLLVPAKLYGRDDQVDSLMGAYNRVADSGQSEIILVSGPAGIGKSTIVGQLQRTLVSKPGSFAAGKFDQYQRDVPYVTIAQAFDDLVRKILSLDAAELNDRRAELLSALGSHAQLMVNLVPHLALIIGEQPLPPALPPQDLRNQFQVVFRRLLGVFARPAHPLILFLDDLQWLDAATADLIEHLVTHPEVRNLLIVGGYRDDEVGASHPLTLKLASIGLAGARVEDVRLAAFTTRDVQLFLADVLQTGSRRVRPLARLVFEKTGGNPFFTIQFCRTLADEGLLTFDLSSEKWEWDLGRTRAKSFTDNVGDLMAAKLGRLSGETQEALGTLACLGDVADIPTLTLLHGRGEAALHTILGGAIQTGFLIRSGDTYRFLHDRVREAAYDLFSMEKRSATHLEIARLLVARASPDELEEGIFKIVNQFVRGSAAITLMQERITVASLHLKAGHRAKTATAYETALKHFAAGRGLLDESGPFDSRLPFDLEINLAECEYLTGDLPSAEARLVSLSMQTRATVELAAVVSVQLNLYTTLDLTDRAVDVALAFMRRVDTRWSQAPSDAAVLQEYGVLIRRLEAESIESLVDLPTMTHPEHISTSNVLSALLAPAQFTDVNLFRLVIVRMATLTLDHGITDGSSLAFALLGSVLTVHLNKSDAGVRLGRLALELVETRKIDRLKGSVYSVYTLHLAHWTQPLATCESFLRQAFQAANEIGDITFAAFARVDLVTILLASGAPLDHVGQEADSALKFARGAHFGLISDVIVAQLQLIRALQGQTPDFQSFNDSDFDELLFENHLEGNSRLAIAASRYWLRKLQARFLADECEAAVAAASKIATLIWTLPSQIELPEYHYYAGIAKAAYIDICDQKQRGVYLEELTVHHCQMSIWAVNCPANFENRTALLGAELARLEERGHEASRLYEQAVKSARDHGFVQNEAIASELAARYYTTLGLETIADAYLGNARSCYEKWGATAKVNQLDRLRPKLAGQLSLSAEKDDIAAIKHLDLSAVISMSQAVSGELVLDRLIERLMKTVLEASGAVRGLLLLPFEDKLRIVAEAKTYGVGVEMNFEERTHLISELPVSIVNIVSRTLKSIVLDDASVENDYLSDAYFREKRPRSVLCLALVEQTTLIGILYLENSLSSHMFSATRQSLLRVIASQAAIAIKNAQLFQTIEIAREKTRQSEAELKQSFDMIPALAWSALPDGSIEFANKRWHDFTGVPTGKIKDQDWIAAFHPDDAAKVVGVWQDLLASGLGGEVDARMLRHDGVAHNFLVRASPMRNENGEIVKWYGTNTEIDALKRNQASQDNLARAARLTSMGQLTVSIAHEVNQPLMAIVTNAATCLRWLADETLNVTEARKAAERIIRDGHRAGDIVASIRSLAKKSPTEMGKLDINQVILEVLLLTRGELHRHGIQTETDLIADMHVVGDRVQMQQVLLNLIMNGIEAIGAGQSELGRLVIRTRLDDEPRYVVVTVADTGDGLDAEVVDKIFDAFFTTKPEGIGLGLAICNSIVEAHGGRLWFEPNMPNGSVFCFSIPTFDHNAGIVPGPQASGQGI